MSTCPGTPATGTKHVQRYTTPGKGISNRNEIWVNANGEPAALHTMDPEYVMNALGMTLRRLREGYVCTLGEDGQLVFCTPAEIAAVPQPS